MIIEENEKLHLHIQDLIDENDTLKRQLEHEKLGRILLDPSNTNISMEEKLRLRVQELEDLIVEMKHQGSSNKIVELENQIEVLNMDLAREKKKMNEFINSFTKDQQNPSKTIFESANAVEYYSDLLKSKEEEIKKLNLKLEANSLNLEQK